MRDLRDITSPLVDGLARGPHSELDAMRQEKFREFLDARCLRLVQEWVVDVAHDGSYVDTRILVDGDEFLQSELYSGVKYDGPCWGAISVLTLVFLGSACRRTSSNLEEYRHVGDIPHRSREYGDVCLGNCIWQVDWQNELVRETSFRL